MCTEPRETAVSITRGGRGVEQTGADQGHDEQQKQDEQHARDFRDAGVPLENGLAADAADLLLPAAAPQEGEHPAAQMEQPGIEMAFQNAGWTDLDPAAIRAGLFTLIYDGHLNTPGIL